MSAKGTTASALGPDAWKDLLNWYVYVIGGSIQNAKLAI